MIDLPSVAFAEMIRRRDQKIMEVDTERGPAYCRGYIEGINEGLRLGMETAQSFMESLTGAHATGQ